MKFAWGNDGVHFTAKCDKKRENKKRALRRRTQKYRFLKIQYI